MNNPFIFGTNSIMNSPKRKATIRRLFNLKIYMDVNLNKHLSEGNAAINTGPVTAWAAERTSESGNYANAGEKAV